MASAPAAVLTAQTAGGQSSAATTVATGDVYGVVYGTVYGQQPGLAVTAKDQPLAALTAATAP